MHEQEQQDNIQNLQFLQNHSLSNKLLQRLKTLQFLQLNNHFSIIILIHALKLLSLLHLVFTYLSVESEPVASQVQNFLALIYSYFILYRAFQTFIYLLKVIKVVAIVIVIRGEQENFSYGVAKKIIKYIIILSQADLLLTSLLLLINFKENILGFVISASMNIGLNIELDNYTNRKLMSYHSSQIGSLLYRCMHILQYFVNSVLVNIGVDTYYYIFNLIIGVVVFKWYVSSGINLYYHARPKYFTMAYISFYLAFIFLLAQRLVLKTDIFDTSKIVECVLLSSFIFVFLFMRSESNRIQYKAFRKVEDLVQNIKRVDLECFELVRRTHTNFDGDNFLVGLFRFHQDEECGNSGCYTHHQDFYDPMYKFRLNVLSDTSKEKESNLRFYIKCLYEQCLSSHKSLGLLLDYCQFLIGEYFDIYCITKVFAEIELHHLNLFDALRLYRMKIAVKEEGTTLNRLIFDGKLQIEKIMKADETFQDVSENISKYLQKTIDIWTTINKNQVNLTSLRGKIHKTFSILDSVNEKWIPLAPYLVLQKRWRFLRMSYSHFILNEKVRQREIDDSNLLEDDDYRRDNAYIEKTAKGNRLFNKELLFDKNSMYLHTAIENKAMYILRNNQRFQDISGFSSSQIIGAELNEFLPDDVRKIHNKSVLEWLQKGQCNNESCYPIQFTELKTKGGKLVPVIKYFKMIINVQANKEDYLHFVCLLKVNSKENVVNKQIFIGFTKSITHIADCFSDKLGKKVENNPFFKEEDLKPKSEMQELSKIKRSLRVLIALLVLMTVGLYFFTCRDANNLNDYSLQYINFLNLYRFPMAFGKNILKTMMNVGNQTKTKDQISYQILMTTALMSDPTTIKSIFDTKLNVPNLYYPFQNNSFNKGIAYNQIDLIYYMVSTMQSLNKLPANRIGEYFTNFNMYITPYDSLINSTKIRFHSSFKGIFESMTNNQIIFLSIQIFIFVLGTVYVTIEVYQYFKKTKDNIRTVIEFNDESVEKIIKYYTQLKVYLCNLAQDEGIKGLIKHGEQIEVTEESMMKGIENRKKEISLNKKSKHIYQSKKEIMRTVKFVILISVIMTVMLVSISSFEITNMIAINRIHSYEEDGFYFLRYFPATSVLGHAILQRYYSQVYPSEITFYPQRYAQSISDLSLIAHADYIGNVLFPDSAYFLDQKNYLFGNPCTFNPSVLVGAQTTQAKCLTIYNKTFSLGITTFLRACEKQVNDFLNARIKLTVAQVDELTVALTLVAYYITDAITTWSSEFTTMIMDFNRHNTIVCLIICTVLIVLHVFSCEFLAFSHLQDDYKFNRRVFEHMVPQQILISEKVTKQKFIINGILHHQ